MSSRTWTSPQHHHQGQERDHPELPDRFAQRLLRYPVHEGEPGPPVRGRRDPPQLELRRVRHRLHRPPPEVHEGGGDAFKIHGNGLVEDCWVHHLGMEPDAHADGDRAGWDRTSLSGTTTSTCRSDCRATSPTRRSSSRPRSGSSTTSCSRATGRSAGTTPSISPTILGAGAPTNCKLLNNRFGRDYHWGVLINDSPNSVISGNVWDDTGELMDINNQ